MGHCMGLPDYYLYNVDASDIDKEGLHGKAGIELMDDALRISVQFQKYSLAGTTKVRFRYLTVPKTARPLYSTVPSQRAETAYLFQEILLMTNSTENTWL